MAADPSPSSPAPLPAPAPADARLHAPWPLAQKILCYIAMAGLAVFAVWYIDRSVPRDGHVPAVMRPQ